jgi:hypothetical protein
MSESAMRASDFLDTLGVNTRIEYTDGGYANLGNIESDMSYLGIHQVRDGISNGWAGSAPLASYIAVAQTGVKFTICLDASSTATLQSNLSLVEQLNEAVPGSVIAVEGPNEINNQPVTYNGVGGLQGALNLQKALYAMVHSSSALQGVAVDYFTGYDNVGVATGPDPATTPGLADYDNQHPYPNNGNAPYQWVNRGQALPNETQPNAPAVYTETGYSTNGGTNGDVNQDVQARYTLDLLMDDAASGIAQTDLYQLMDAYQPGSPQGDDGYGLFDPNNKPKEAATAIHNLTSILADTGAAASSFTTNPLAYSVTGMPSTGHSMEMQKSDGATDIVVWNEPEIWNESKGTEVKAATQNATVNLGATYQTVEVYDPLTGTTPIETLSNVSSVSLGLTDHPLIVQVEPNTVTPPTTDTIDLNVSEAPRDGDAEFTVSVNGQQVGGDYTAHVLNSSGDAGVVQLTGDWGSGVNDVQVNFINQAWGRNLYVNSIAENGVTYAGTSGALLKKGSSETFAVGGTTPVAPAADPTATAASSTPAPPADTLTLNLSEDAYEGDAQFVLYIDGKPVTTKLVVTALHDANQTQGFTFTGNWGAGTHTIGVGFTNYTGGASASDARHLYINGVTVNGSDVFSGVKEQTSDGISTFSVTTTH